MRIASDLQTMSIKTDLSAWQRGRAGYVAPTGLVVVWYYAVDLEYERTRCFTEEEQLQVIEFLSTVTLTNNLRHTSLCFSNPLLEDCDNETCEEVIASACREIPPVFKIKPALFGVGGISGYTLDFDIIGYVS